MALVHLADDSIASRMGKINQYTANEIEKKKDRNYGMAALFYRPLVRFFRAYIQKGGFRDGKEDLYVPAMKASISLLLLARL